ncbi:O-antigen ligase family protein [Geobacter sulfurreducens]|uniref:O-antigen ligase family protein n=1 Tax=Geobacter sulfurreducens TaxID=35554 RepID=UPI002C23654B|nr:O-antigen ligase family protein [Geobacter sulfurreducens]HML78022.1 O-antigen ligase family protein [Geobacter sulfurreducens]
MQNFITNNSQANALDRELAQNYIIDYPYINKALLMLFCGYVVVWYLQIGYRIPALGAVRFEFIYASILTVIALLFTPRIDKNNPLFKYILLYIIVILVQLPFSYDFNKSWDVFVDRIIKFAFLAFFIVSFVRSPTHLKWFLAAFLFACLKMGQEGFIGRITGNMIWENQGVMRLNGSTPLYAHPNSFSGMALGTLPFAYYLWPVSSKYIKVILLIIAVLSLNIIIYTGSRTGYIGFVAFMVFIATVSNNKKKVIIIISTMLAVSTPFVPTDYKERFSSIFTGKDKEGGSTEARKQIIEDAWLIFKEHPFGIGISAFPKVRGEKFGRSQDTHNLYLEILTNLGIQGFIVVTLLFIKMIKMLTELRLKINDCLNKMNNNKIDRFGGVVSDLNFMYAVTTATLGYLIIRLVLGLFGMDLYEIYWWFISGVTWVLYVIVGKIEREVIIINDVNESVEKTIYEKV